MQSINPHAVHGESGTGFEKRGKRGPFECSNCEYFKDNSCGQADMMKKSKEPRLANGRVKVGPDDCCDYVERRSSKRGLAARFRAK
jgi:hypothetical protein